MIFLDKLCRINLHIFVVVGNNCWIFLFLKWEYHISHLFYCEYPLETLNCSSVRWCNHRHEIDREKLSMHFLGQVKLLVFKAFVETSFHLSRQLTFLEKLLLGTSGSRFRNLFSFIQLLRYLFVKMCAFVLIWAWNYISEYLSMLISDNSLSFLLLVSELPRVNICSVLKAVLVLLFRSCVYPLQLFYFLIRRFCLIHPFYLATN